MWEIATSSKREVTAEMIRYGPEDSLKLTYLLSVSYGSSVHDTGDEVRIDLQDRTEIVDSSTVCARHFLL